MAHQVLEQCVLAAGEVNTDVVTAGGDPGLGVERDVSDAQDASRCGPLTRRCSDAGGQLGEGEGLDQVVIGASIKEVDLVVDVPECADDDDREFGMTDPNGLEHVDALAVRQDQVEQDEIEVVRGPQRDSL